MQLFDSHAHLDSEPFEADRDLVIARAVEAGVTCILTCGSDLESSHRAVELAQAYPQVCAAVGIHAHRATSAMLDERAAGDAWRLDEAALEQLAALAARPQVVALGEVGLDYHYNFSPPESQRVALARQLILAHELGLPVVLHNRESDADLREMIDSAPVPVRGVLHCFMADESMARWALARGLYIGVAGPITFKNAQRLRAIVRQLPLERLLIETDAPYLAPHPVRGARNEPAHVRHVAAELAETLALSLDDIGRITTENACRLFGVSDHAR